MTEKEKKKLGLIMYGSENNVGEFSSYSMSDNFGCYTLYDVKVDRKFVDVSFGHSHQELDFIWLEAIDDHEDEFVCSAHIGTGYIFGPLIVGSPMVTFKEAKFIRSPDKTYEN